MQGDRKVVQGALSIFSLEIIINSSPQTVTVIKFFGTEKHLASIADLVNSHCEIWFNNSVRSSVLTQNLVQKDTDDLKVHLFSRLLLAFTFVLLSLTAHFHLVAWHEYDLSYTVGSKSGNRSLICFWFPLVRRIL